MMKIEFLENSPEAIRFSINDVSTDFVNALRRTIISRVKTFAIDTVTFYINTSAMFDEYIAHRIGLVPILTPEGYDEKDEILFTLDMEGPCTVYSKDLVSSDKKVKVAIEDIPLIKLAEGQRIKLEGKAIMGNGAKSAKFQPGLATYEKKGEGKFEFYIETFGQMPSREILNKALEIIEDDLKDAEKGLK
ncbi:MAG: DNA-directed RNA polymerase subunit D [Candidatus Micrarchaeia archaeon]